jgi:dTDP-4-amino-4,6-dideoxygalactose transaminase
MKPFLEPIYVTRPLVPDPDKYIRYFKEIIKTKQITNGGPYLLELEEKLKSYLGVKNNAAFCNGTTALMIALKALNLKGSVLTTPFTFPATANVLEWAGLETIFCDIDYNTMNIDPEKVEECLKLRWNEIDAILAVHTFGEPCNLEYLEILKTHYNIKLIYDSAHAFGAEMVESDGSSRGIGTYGDISMFSFHATKLFHTCEGGMLTYNDDSLDEQIKQLRNFGIKDDKTGSIRAGINGKMNELQAAMGLCIMDKIHEDRRKRARIKYIYKMFLEPGYQLIHNTKVYNKSFQYYPIRIKGKRDKVYEHLKKHNVHARKYFYPLCSDFPHFRRIHGDFPVAKKVSEEILCLPFYGDLKEDEATKICEIINEV